MSKAIEIAEVVYRPFHIRKRLDKNGVHWVVWMQGHYDLRTRGKTLVEALTIVARLIDKEKP